MAQFDLRTFAKLIGGGQTPSASLGVAFGMPSCLLNLNKEILSIFPSSVLNSISQSNTAARNKADEAVKEVLKLLTLKTGLIEFDTETGTFKFVSDSSLFGMDNNENKTLKALSGFVAGLSSAAAAGGRLYNNYNTTKAQIDGIIECIDNYTTVTKFTAGASAQRDILSEEELTNQIEAEFAGGKKKIDSALEFIAASEELNSNISDILYSRRLDPSLEPIFLADYSNILSGTEFKIEEPIEKEVEEIFRLVFGPPKSKSGQFLLSVDGLYYDSQTSGIVPALLSLQEKKSKLKESDKWRFEHDPNLGGKGKQISIDRINKYTDTLFDPNLIDDSPKLLEYYAADQFLLELEGQKNKRILDLSAQTMQYERTVDYSSALAENFKKSISAEIAAYQYKIDKRKKQIEIAVKAPSIYGGKGGLFPIGEVPINDFSYLGEYNFSTELDKQKRLILDQAEVSSVILPLQPQYVINPGNKEGTTIEHLLVPEIGIGGIIFDSSSISGTDKLQLTLKDIITTDGLIATYNFLENEVEVPSSLNFKLSNHFTSNTYNAAQLVGPDASSLYPSGLGIIYLDGITKHSSINPLVPSGVGGYVKLPDTTEFMDWTYSINGFTFETWLHLPDFNDEDIAWGGGYGSPSSLTKVILGCENVGVASSVQEISGKNLNRITPEFGIEYIRGMLIGVSRDRRLTQNLDWDLASSSNDISKSVLFIAPTQSVNSSSVAFLNSTRTSENGCASSTEFHKCSFPISSISDVSSTFVLVTITVDPERDEVKMYADGVLLTTSSMFSSFGISRGRTVGVPSFKGSNSFEYSTSYMDAAVPADLKYGPELNKYFTPWILGGGYTDGYTARGNFMGGDGYGLPVGGITSGLRGFLGGVKFYNRALKGSEILKNYNGQRYFFKYIAT